VVDMLPREDVTLYLDLQASESAHSVEDLWLAALEARLVPAADGRASARVDKRNLA